MSSRPVLVVEDDLDIRESLGELIAGEGFPVHTVKNGHEALVWLEAGPQLPALMLLDLQMPQMSGVELLDRIAAELPQARAVPVVVLTAANQLPEIDGVECLRKPIDLELLLQTINRYVGTVR